MKKAIIRPKIKKLTKKQRETLLITIAALATAGIMRQIFLAADKKNKRKKRRKK